jgi:Pyridoxamine 5'-phosphate oxidase
LHAPSAGKRLARQRAPKRSGPKSRARPSMADGYGIKRDSKGMISWSAVAKQLAKARNYWLVTSRRNGRPHVAPVWGLWLDGHLWFSTDPASRKGRDLAANPSCIVHLESGDDVVIIEGVAERRAPRSPSLSKVARRYEKKYGFRLSVGNPSHGVYEMRPTKAFAWFERNFPDSATRWLF